jgi:dTDP-4-dehydrorhamnose 3,5-epimerase-like enzyme
MKKHKSRQSNLPAELQLKPRVRIDWNTGTRIILSKKDKSKLRRILKADFRKELSRYI